jgi:hypothetical protein
LRKGFAFTERAPDLVHRLRLRLNRRGEASPKNQQSNSESQKGKEGVKKSSSHVIPSEARNLHLFVFKEINADASLRAA